MRRNLTRVKRFWPQWSRRPAIGTARRWPSSSLTSVRSAHRFSPSDIQAPLFLECQHRPFEVGNSGLSVSNSDSASLLTACSSSASCKAYLETRPQAYDVLILRRAAPLGIFFFG